MLYLHTSNNQVQTPRDGRVGQDCKKFLRSLCAQLLTIRDTNVSHSVFPDESKARATGGSVTSSVTISAISRLGTPPRPFQRRTVGSYGLFTRGVFTRSMWSKARLTVLGSRATQQAAKKNLVRYQHYLG